MKSINPATEEVVAEYPEHDPAQIERIVSGAHAAFGKWRGTSIEDRCKRLKKAGELLRARRLELAKLMTTEMGKTIGSAEAEADKCALACDFYADNAARFLANRSVATETESYLRFDPIGSVLAIMPWNFPFWQTIRATVPALAAGNVLLLKHAPNVTGCALAIERIFHDAGFTESVFSALLIADNARAERLAAHPMIQGVTLTGSECAGSAVAALAAKSLKKTVMELGGSDPFIVLADAALPAAAQAAAEARCFTTGQSCIAAKRIIVEEAIFEKFQSEFVAAMKTQKVGDPMDRSVTMGPLARLDLLENLDLQVQRTIAQGAKLLLGGHRRAGKGFFYEPTVLGNVVPGMAAFDEETFGPAAALVRAKDADEAIGLANQTRYGLGASVWTRDLNRGRNLAARLDAGVVCVNEKVKSDPRLPFGGIKNSGWGRELGEIGIHEFVNIKTVWVR